MEALVADLRDQATRLAAESAQRESEWAAEKRDLQTRVDGALAAQANDTGSVAKYSSLVDEMSVTIAELEQKVQTAESRLQEYEELKKKSSKAPTLIEGMLRADVESLSARVAQLEEERTLWSHETTDDAIAAASSQDRKERLNGIAEKLRTAIAILERSTGSH
jgi:DNA repair exonuclease SbcCD ATPase subunit